VDKKTKGEVSGLRFIGKKNPVAEERKLKLNIIRNIQSFIHGEQHLRKSIETDMRRLDQLVRNLDTTSIGRERKNASWRQLDKEYKTSVSMYRRALISPAVTHEEAP